MGSPYHRCRLIITVLMPFLTPIYRHCRLALAGLAALSGLQGCVSYQAAPLDAARMAVDFESLSLHSWPGHGGPWTLAKLTAAAFHFHPSLAEARAEVAAADAAIITAGQRPNPALTTTTEYDFTKGAASPWIWGLNVEIPIETGGKRAARLLKARAEANAARCRLAGAAQKVRNGVRLAVIDAAAAETRVALVEQQRHIQEDLVKLLKDRVTAGETPLTELTTYQLALNRAALDSAAARRDQGRARAALATAVGLPGHAFNGVRPVFDLAAVDIVSDQARRAALRTHPAVLAALADYAAAEAALKLETARQYPDLRISNGFLWDQGDRKWQLPGLGMELPVFHRNQGGIAEALVHRTAAAAKLRSAQARISGEIEAAQASLKGAQDQVMEAGRLLKSERQAEDQAAQSLKAGGGDRLEKLTATVQSATGSVALLEVQVLAQQAAAALEDAIQPAAVIEPVMKEIRQP